MVLGIRSHRLVVLLELCSQKQLGNEANALYAGNINLVPRPGVLSYFLGSFIDDDVTFSSMLSMCIILQSVSHGYRYAVCSLRSAVCKCHTPLRHIVDFVIENCARVDGGKVLYNYTSICYWYAGRNTVSILLQGLQIRQIWKKLKP